MQVLNANIHYLLGTLVTVWLYGATCIQVHQYCNNFGSDRFVLKYAVAFIFTLETVHAALCSHFVYYMATIENYDAYFLRNARTAVAAYFIGIVIAWIVNLFFIHRIYILSEKNLWLSVVFSILATIRPVFGLAIVIFTIIYPSIPTFTAHATWIMTTTVSIKVLVDGLIAICTSYFLLKGRNKVVASTRSIINTLLKYIIHTGVILLIVACFQLMAVVQWLSRGAIATAIFHVEVQLYANCFLTMLNARHKIRHAMENSSMVILSDMASRPVANREVSC